MGHITKTNLLDGAELELNLASPISIRELLEVAWFNSSIEKIKLCTVALSLDSSLTIRNHLPALLN
jgi:hypothetical protein